MIGLEVVFIILAIIGILTTVMVSKEARVWLIRNLSAISLRFKFKFLKEMEELGVKKIYRTRTDAEMKNPFFSLDTSISLHTVYAMGVSLAPIKNLGDERIKYHLEQGCKFKFLLLNPDSPFMKQRAHQENPDLKGETDGFLVWIKSFASEYKAQIDVLCYDLMPTMAITIINDDVLFVNPYSMLRRNQEFPVIEVKKGGSLFDLYKAEYEKVLGHKDTEYDCPRKQTEEYRLF